jgi:HPr kinase/phosphorylase
LLLEKGKKFDLSVVAGEAGLGNSIMQSELHRPGLAIAGFLDIFTFDRVQILGNTEVRYLHSLETSDRRRRLRALFEFPIPCFVVTTNNVPPSELVDLCNEFSVPLLRTSYNTSRFNAMIGFWLEREFAPSLTLHGVLVDVFGVGVLIGGDSGIGKSECGLELIERGHRLIADDLVVVRQLGGNILMGSPVSQFQHHMEVRGLGIVDVELLFGIGSIREEKRVSLFVDLQRWENAGEIERLGMDPQYVTYLDVPVRYFRIPVDSGRNISILIEVAALQHRVFQRGRNPAEELNKRLVAEMALRGQG